LRNEDETTAGERITWVVLPNVTQQLLHFALIIFDVNLELFRQSLVATQQQTAKEKAINKQERTFLRPSRDLNCVSSLSSAIDAGKIVSLLLLNVSLNKEQPVKQTL